MADGGKRDSRFVALVLNPVKVDASDLKAAVIAASHTHGWGAPLFEETTIADPGQGATKRALEAGASVVLVAGGDGTVRAVSEAMVSTGVPLVIVPSGTGNLLARNLHLPLADTAACIDAAFVGETTPVDVGIATVTRADGSTEEHAFVVMAGIGLDAAMIQNTNPKLKKSVGWVAYLDGAARSLTKAKPFRVMFQIAGEHIRTTRTHSILWANCGVLPAGIVLLPDASIRDGQLDFALFQPRRWWEWYAVWRTVWWHNSVLRRTKAGTTLVSRLRGTGAVRFYQGESLEAALSEPHPVQFDGDELGEAMGLHGRIERDGLTVRVPAGITLP